MTMSKGRTRNAVINVAVNLTSKVLQLLLSFVFRTLLIRYAGNEILGLDGLFSSIVTVLNMADLGIVTAVIYFLYRPIVECDYEKIAATMNFFQKFYISVGVFVLSVGCALIPILPFLVKLPENSNVNINLIYVLTIINTATSYFLSSRRIIFEANQELYRLTLIDFIVQVALQITQIIIIVTIKNYIAILIARIVYQVLTNIFIWIYALKKYPWLKNKSKLSKDCKKTLLTNTSAVMVHKVGGVLVTGTDNIIISSFISTLLVGFYSNYNLIISSLSTIAIAIITVLTPSIGNLKESSKDIEHHYKIFKKINSLSYIMIAFMSICLFNLINPFIQIWLGKEYLFDTNVVLVLCVNFYISLMRYPIGAFATAGGYFKQTTIKPIAESIINLVVSLSLVNYIGILGVFLGTTVSLVLGSLWVEPVIVYKKWFKKNSLLFFINYIMQFIVLVVLSTIIYYINKFITFENEIGSFVCKMVIAIIISILGLFAYSLIVPEFRETLVAGKRKIKKVFRKK